MAASGNPHRCLSLAFFFFGGFLGDVCEIEGELLALEQLVEFLIRRPDRGIVATVAKEKAVFLHERQQLAQGAGPVGLDVANQFLGEFLVEEDPGRLIEPVEVRLPTCFIMPPAGTTRSALFPAELQAPPSARSTSAACSRWPLAHRAIASLTARSYVSRSAIQLRPAERNGPALLQPHAANRDHARRKILRQPGTRGGGETEDHRRRAIIPSAVPPWPGDSSRPVYRGSARSLARALRANPERISSMVGFSRHRPHEFRPVFSRPSPTLELIADRRFAARLARSSRYWLYPA